MPKADIVEALADCLETVRLGADLEACLQRYPEYRAELKAHLEVVSMIRPLREDVAPSPDFREAARWRLLAPEAHPPERAEDAGGASDPYQFPAGSVSLAEPV